MQQNKNQILENRRRDRGVTPDGDVTFEDIAERLKKNITFIPYEEPEPETPKNGEGERPLTPLEQMSTHWVPAKQRALYGEFLQSAKKWIAERPSSPGLSFLVAGPTGIGKTTALRNMQQSLTRTMCTEDVEFDIFEGKFWTAREAMRYMEPLTGGTKWQTDRRPLSKMLEGVKALVLDDVGYEEIPFSSHEDFLVKRRNRYHDLFSYCYDHNVSLLISTNTPISDGGRISDKIMEILGDTAVDRLLGMTRGMDYTFDLTGIPYSYRVWEVNQKLSGSKQ